MTDLDSWTETRGRGTLKVKGEAIGEVPDVSIFKFQVPDITPRGRTERTVYRGRACVSITDDCAPGLRESLAMGRPFTMELELGKRRERFTTPSVRITGNADVDWRTVGIEFQSAAVEQPH